MPMILFTMMIMVFFTLYLYQGAMLQQMGSAVVERSSYNWDNSHKEASSGTYEEGKHDPLYWRVTDDGMLGKLFGWAGADNTVAVALPGGSSNGSLPAQKLANASGMVKGEMQGEITYQNSLLMRKVNVELKQVISLPPLDQILAGGSTLQIDAQSVVVEPTEFIRTVELMRYYGSKFKSTGDDATNKSEASQVVSKFSKKTK